MDISDSSDEDITDHPNIQVGMDNKMTVDSKNGMINCRQTGHRNTIVLNLDTSHELPEDTEVNIKLVFRKANVPTVETHISINGNPAAEERMHEAAQNRGVWQSLRQFFNTLYARLERVYRGSVVIELQVKDANFLPCVEKAAKEGRLSEIILQLLQEESVFEKIKGQKVEITVEVRIPEGQYEEMSKEMDRKKQDARKLVETLLTSSRNEEVVQRQSVKGLEDVAAEVASLGTTLNIAMVGGAALGTAALLAAPFTLGASLGLGAATVVALIAAFALAIKKSEARQSAQVSLDEYSSAVESLDGCISTLMRQDEVMKDMVEHAVIERLKVEPIQISDMMISIQQSAGSASKLVVNVDGETIPIHKLNLYDFITKSVKNKRRPPSKVQKDIRDMARQIERMEVNPLRGLLSSA
ncbi:uncharacterized protein LOC124152960 [Haliotis rufescens]|uniref:uncharacterized protein LOC124152960 n=1 Tax=Haliotis rufescens TaxID=6454 RepID=UPI00201EC2C6|nr:uncharacterized protein LOC124152960 [Haliotis rufescens]